MRIYNATYKNVTLDWENVTLPINEGSPISADGKVSNDSDAIGLCPRYIWQEPLENKTVPILIGGDVVLPEVEAEYGESLTDDALASMGGINFYDDDGSIDKESGGGGGGGTDRFFEVHLDEETYTLDKTWREIFNAIKDGKIPFFITSSESSGFKFASFWQCNRAFQIEEEEKFCVYFYGATYFDGSELIEGIVLYADSENGYPAPLGD